jgi:hypothetical protein
MFSSIYGRSVNHPSRCCLATLNGFPPNPRGC